MVEKVYTKSYPVNSIVVRPNHRLGLVGLLAMLQDIAGEHGNILGVGYSKMLETNTFWVLTRQKLVMDSWPKWGETVELTTWTRPFVGARAFRDYEISCGGRKIGESVTSWVILDGETRKPKNPDLDFSNLAREDYALNLNTDKLEQLETPEELKTFEVRNSDLDMNLHVNNTKYAQWISDSIPFERHKDGVIKEYEINFLAETHLGDVITVQHQDLSSEGKSIFDLRFQGVRKGDEKIAFVARILAETE